MSFRTESTPNLSGIGMTSQRTRERLLGRLMDQGITSMEVLDVIRSTPRHIFLDEALSHRAYEDVALPIGFNQTISQPYIVARMTEIAFLSGPDKCPRDRHGLRVSDLDPRPTSEARNYRRAY